MIINEEYMSKNMNNSMIDDTTFDTHRNETCYAYPTI